MLVPYYWNKKSTDKTYENNDYTWISLDKFLAVLSDDVLKDFENFNWFDLENETKKNEFKEKCAKYPPINIKGDNFVPFEKFIISAKLLFMTWFTCKYGFWKKWELNDLWDWKVYTHHWIDLILPKWTPIISFTCWDVVAAQYAKGYWNYVVIRSDIDWEILYFCYEHLDELKVEKWEKVEKNDIIWTCWNSWRAYWYHLHFQIDKNTWNFHPYWSFWQDDVEKTEKNCIDPWNFLRKHYLKQKDQVKNIQKNDDFDIVWELTKELSKKEKTTKLTSFEKKQTKIKNIELASSKKTDSFEKKDYKENDEDFIAKIKQDISKNSSTWNYIDFFINAWVLKWENWNYLLNQSLTRYQITLILYRLYKAWLLPIENIKTSCDMNYKDITWNLKNDKEFLKALDFVVCNGIITWDNNKFFPWNKLIWEQFLAIIWRLFAGLKNSSWLKWYETYYNWAIDKKIIPTSWPFIWHFITREEVFKIFYKLILS